MTTVVKMIGKSVEKKEEIRAYIRARSKIGCSLKQIFAEMSVVYGCLMTRFVDGKINLILDSGLV